MASVHTRKQHVIDDIMTSASLATEDEYEARDRLAKLSKPQLDFINRLVAGAWSTGYHSGESSRA